MRPQVQRVQRDGQQRQEEEDQQGRLEDLDPVGRVYDCRGRLVALPAVLLSKSKYRRGAL